MVNTLLRRSALVALLATGMVSLAACGGGDDDTGNGGDEPTQTTIEVGGDEELQFQGVRVQPQIPKPDFTLTDTEGEPFDIKEETEGYVTLLYLGYTHCPDICPLHMLDIAETLKQMEPEDAERIKVVFVTTDPERDTPEIIRRWLDLFNEDFIGLTADQETIDQLQRAVGTQPAQQVESDRVEGYEVNHAAYVMAFTKEDNLAYTVYPVMQDLSGFPREAWLNDMTLLVREGYTD
jgi:protein SCO1